MKHPKVKICDVRTPEIAKFCSENGVDFIGLHQINVPISQEKIENFRAIIEASGNMAVVLVTQIDDINELIKVVCALPWDYVQLHFNTTVDFITALKQRVFDATDRHVGVIAVFQANQCDFEHVQKIAEVTDYLLFDTSMRGGTGLLTPIESIQLIRDNCSNNKYFIAGGLKPDNVADTVKLIHPYALDVQSGVEKEKHVKDKEKILEFVRAARLIEV